MIDPLASPGMMSPAHRITDPTMIPKHSHQSDRYSHPSFACVSLPLLSTFLHMYVMLPYNPLRDAMAALVDQLQDPSARPQRGNRRGRGGRGGRGHSGAVSGRGGAAAPATGGRAGAGSKGSPVAAQNNRAKPSARGRGIAGARPSANAPAALRHLNMQERARHQVPCLCQALHHTCDPAQMHSAAVNTFLLRRSSGSRHC